MVYYGSERYTDLLVKANPHIKDPGELSAGQVIEIPPAPARTGRSGTASPKERTAKARRTYLVKPGDTFYGIAQAHLGSGPRWREIFELNKSVVRDDPKGLRPGQTLILPEKRESDG
jgi:nucleoid-associated protein YgaU